MEILQVKHLQKVSRDTEKFLNQLKKEIKEETDRREQLNEELRVLMYKLVEVKQRERPALVVTKKEAMRLLGGISVFKMHTLIEKGILTPVKIGGEGRAMYRLSELEAVTKATT